ncbi:hypothetical protein HAX54_008341 [Datura stramonium]|uniref:Uncharacterized protein n=1 Tax=Datura stramonium TaxID=4076 RepID=A0ABS8TEH0_DATST|nr:hypothetical protein [Datura stramonium]
MSRLSISKLQPADKGRIRAYPTKSGRNSPSTHHRRSYHILTGLFMKKRGVLKTPLMADRIEIFLNMKFTAKCAIFNWHCDEQDDMLMSKIENHFNHQDLSDFVGLGDSCMRLPHGGAEDFENALKKAGLL